MRSQGRDWRIWLGLSLSGAWLLLGMAYVSSTVGWAKFASLPADKLGSFLEGAFAPLAFLWLVIGYFLQQKELQQNSRALQAQAVEIQRTAEQAVIQSRQMAASELHARQETFLRIAESVREQLGAISGMLYVSSQGNAGSGAISREEMATLFAQLSAGDDALFSRRLLQLSLELDDPDSFDLFYGTAIRARHTNHFVFVFERLVRRATELDTEDMIRDTLLASGHAFMYNIAKRHQADAPEGWRDHTETGIHFNL